MTDNTEPIINVPRKTNPSYLFNEKLRFFSLGWVMGLILTIIIYTFQVGLIPKPMPYQIIYDGVVYGNILTKLTSILYAIILGYTSYISIMMGYILGRTIGEYYKQQEKKQV